MDSESHKLYEALEAGNVSLDLGALGKRSLRLCEPSPCTVACPAHVNVKAYVSLIADGRFHEALEVVKERLPFPGICGRVCMHPCEEACRRNDVDKAVAIRPLKRFIADIEMDEGYEPPPPPERTRKETVAVIGAGPAGLTAATDLVRLGYGVVVYDALEEPGGMMLTGIPPYRLPRNILKTEIGAIAQLGVEIRMGKRLGRDVSLEELHKEHAAVFLAIGAHKGYNLGIPGEEGEGIHDAITFLRESHLGEPKAPGKQVLVIGGGNSAMDASRTSMRLGADAVTVVYRRTQQEMPATEAERQEAEDEGVKFHYLVAPLEVLRENGKVTGLRCIKTELGEPDASGRRRPVPIEGSEFDIPADCIIPAIGQEGEMEGLPTKELSPKRPGRISVNADTLETPLAGVFAGGDIALGPSSIIDAVAQGHVAAASIHHYISGEQLPELPEAEWEVEIDEKPEEAGRISPELRPPETRRADHEEVELRYSEAQAMAEAGRCMRCGPCWECAVCVPACPKQPAILSPGTVEGKPMMLRMYSRVASEIPGGQEALLHIAPTDGGTAVEETLRLESLACRVQEELCRGCGDCAEVCPYDIPTLTEVAAGKMVSSIDPLLCRGCGSCAAQCPTGAIEQGHYSEEAIGELLQALDPAGSGPKSVRLACRWSVAAEPQPLKDGFLTVTVPCASRLHPGVVLQAFRRGAKEVLVTGCGDDGCKYGALAHAGGHSVHDVTPLLELLGIDTERFRVERSTTTERDVHALHR